MRCRRQNAFCLYCPFSHANKLLCDNANLGVTTNEAVNMDICDTASVNPRNIFAEVCLQS